MALKKYLITFKVDEEMVKNITGEKSVNEGIKKEFFQYADLCGIYLEDVKTEVEENDKNTK